MRRDTWKKLVCLLTIFVLVLMGSFALLRCRGQNHSHPQSAPTNRAEVIQAIRGGLRNHSRKINVRFFAETEMLSELPAMVEEWVTEALGETDDPCEGDYIRYQYGGYHVSCQRETDEAGYWYTVSVVPTYYMYLYQEEQVTEKVEELLDGFGFDSNMTDYEKVRTIYDYVCTHIRYDKVHEGNPYHTLRSTSYAGLVWGSATCQGYCVTLYRLLREAGISCRIVTGTGHQMNGDSFHAWNIVELNGLYYGLDATWDAGKEEYANFLKGSTTFADHTPGETFMSDEFQIHYPMAESDYGG